MKMKGLRGRNERFWRLQGRKDNSQEFEWQGLEWEVSSRTGSQRKVYGVGMKGFGHCKVKKRQFAGVGEAGAKMEGFQ